MFCPPTDEQIEQYAREVCEHLSQKHSVDYCQTDILRGFTEFVKIAVRIRAKQLGATYDKENNEEIPAG